MELNLACSCATGKKKEKLQEQLETLQNNAQASEFFFFLVHFSHLFSFTD